MAEEEQLGKLKKYVPFIDYIIKVDHKQKDNLVKMRQWMLDQKKLSKEHSEKIERSIIGKYKEISMHPSFPAELHKIFAVDMCSDDDHIVIASQRKIAEKKIQDCVDIVTILSDSESDDSDIEFISVTTPNLQKSPPSSNKNNMYEPILTIDKRHSSAQLPLIPQAPQQPLCRPFEEFNEFHQEIESSAMSSSTDISHTLNFIEPPQPAPPPTLTPVNIRPNLTELSIPVIINSQKQAKRLHGQPNVYTPQSYSSNLDCTLSMEASYQLPSRSNLVPIQTVSHNSIPVITSSLQIGLRRQELPPPSSNLNYASNSPSTPNSLPTGSGNPVSLSMPIYSTMANPTSSVSNSLPANPTITNPIHAAPTPTRSQLLLKDPRVRKMIAEGSYGQCRQQPPTITQTSSHSGPATIIHSWDQPDSSSANFQTDQMVQTLSKNIEPSTMQTATSYGNYIREMKRRRQEYEETVKRDEEIKRNEEERKRLEKEKQQQATKKLEEVELKKQTEHIKQILNTRQDEIGHEIKDSSSRKRQTCDANAFTSNKSQINQKPSAANSINDYKKTCSAQDRALRELKCTVIGFNTIQDFMSTNGDGKRPKRRSSLSARIAIASQLDPLDQERPRSSSMSTDDEVCTVIGFNTIQDFTSRNGDGKRPKRRSSLSARIAIASQLGPLDQERRRSSSMSTDDEVHPIKRKKNNEKVKENTLPKMRSCKVMLKRMSNVVIAKYLKKDHATVAPITTIAKKNPFATTLSIATALKPTNEVKKNTQGILHATKSSSASIDLKNIDCQMTERNCDTCVLCKVRSSHLTDHFIRIHKKESYLSRLTWEELGDLAMQAPFAEEVQMTPQNGKSIGTGKFIQHYKVKCPFCPESQRKIIDTFPNLRLHYSTHTGEYAFQCKGCGLQKPYRKDITSHQKRKKCVDSGWQTLYQYPPDLMTIYMYVCQICNFVQLNEENVFKHLREQHGKMHENQRYVEEYTLAAIKDGPIERVKIGMIPGSENLMEDTYLQQENNENENKNVAVSNGTQKEANVHENAECFEQTALGIKPETDPLTDSIFLNSKEKLIKLINANEVDLKTVEKESINEEKPDPEKLALESAKAILHKYSANTGIQPDLLYHCADPDCRGYFSNFKLWSSHMTRYHNALITRCPHCMKTKKHTDTENVELPITDFEQHFQTHSLRSFICFHCDTRCVGEKDLREHAKQTHSDITEVRIDRIQFNFTYAYHVLIAKDILTTRLNFLLELCTVLRERIQRIEAQTDDSEYVTAQWSVSETTSWLEDLNLPIYFASASKPKCMLSSCQQTFSNPVSLLEHLKVHNSHAIHLFTCMLCGISGPPKTLATIVTHSFMHSGNLFVCCVCKYITYDRRVLSKHICSEHDKRDVLVLGIWRSETDVNCTIEFVFASGSKTFTTSRECFCGCGTNDLRVDTFVSHLRREHMLKLRYFCQHCDERLPQLQLSDEHFRLKHAESDLVVKVRCQLACSKDRHVNIVSLQPLQIRLSDESYHLSTRETGSPIKNNTANSDDNNDDSGIIFMEEDEVVAEQEAKEAQKMKTVPCADIKCTSIWKLKA